VRGNLNLEKEFEKFGNKQRSRDRIVDLYSEDHVVELLEKKAECEDWTVVEKHPGLEHGVDLKLQKGNRVIVIEAKGERKARTQHGAVKGALGAIIMHMTEGTADRAYCVAFPSTDAFRNLACSIPTMPRQRLGLNIILVEETGLLNILFPNALNPSKVNRFDELFNLG